LDEWCPSGPDGLYVPMVICQAWDPRLAASEIERCIGKGARALAFVDRPVSEGLPSFHSDAWDPIWSVLHDAGIPMCLHIGSGGFISPLNDPLSPEVGRLVIAPFTAMASMIDLILSPVCHKFPDIKIVFSEAGIGWVPSFLERADRSTARQSGWAEVYSRALKPSEIFRRNMYVCMVEEPVGLSFHDLIGNDRILSETDYPHSDTTYPVVQAAFSELLRGIPNDVVEAVTHGNAEKIFGWKMADAALVDSPEVVAWRDELATNPHAAVGREPLPV
ncbi:MAG: amidohydrolase family protein, partial [Acidimicrobiales bacterium]